MLSAVLIIFGLHDMAEQHRLGEEIRWRFPIILFGTGSGILGFLLFFPDMFSTEGGGLGSDGSDDSGAYGGGGGDGSGGGD